MKARLYDPAIGRFLSPDPIVSDPGNAQGLNAYSYVGNNPTNWTDPFGLERDCGPGDDCWNVEQLTAPAVDPLPMRTGGTCSASPAPDASRREKQYHDESAVDLDPFLIPILTILFSDSPPAARIHLAAPTFDARTELGSSVSPSRAGSAARWIGNWLGGSIDLASGMAVGAYPGAGLLNFEPLFGHKDLFGIGIAGGAALGLSVDLADLVGSGILEFATVGAATPVAASAATLALAGTAAHLANWQRGVNYAKQGSGANSGASNASGGPGISRQKQAGHIEGTPQNLNRVSQGKPTSTFINPGEADTLTEEAWASGQPLGSQGNLKILDFGRPVGVGPTGGGYQTQVRVSIDAKGLIHGSPYGPVYSGPLAP